MFMYVVVHTLHQMVVCVNDLGVCTVDYDKICCISDSVKGCVFVITHFCWHNAGSQLLIYNKFKMCN